MKSYTNFGMKKSLKINAILSGIRQCLAILFPLITFPYVSRILGNEGFGKYSFSWSVVSYFILLAGLGMNTYAIREGAGIRDDKEKIRTFSSEAFTINGITTSFSFLLLLLATFLIPKLSDYAPYILTQSSALFLAWIGCDWINSIYEDFLYITVRYTIVQILSLILMFSLIKDSNDVWKYCLIVVLASFGGNLFNVFYIRKYVKIRPTTHPNLRRHIKPLLTLFITQIAITIYVNSDITMLGFYYPDSVVGSYSLASKIYSMIKTIVNAMVVVMLPRMTYILENNPEEYKPTLKLATSYIIILLFPMSCGLFMFGKETILIAGGSTYLDGLSALKILSIAMIFAVLCSFIMNSILIANRKEKHCLYSTLISAVVNVVLNLAILPRFGMSGAAVTTVIAEVVNLVILGYFAYQEVGLSYFDIKNVYQSLISSISIIIIYRLLTKLRIGVFLTFLLGVIISIPTYFILLILMKNTYAISIKNTIVNKMGRGMT